MCPSQPRWSRLSLVVTRRRHWFHCQISNCLPVHYFPFWASECTVTVTAWCLHCLCPAQLRSVCLVCRPRQHVSRVQSTIVWHCHNTAPTLNSLDQAFTREEVYWIGLQWETPYWGKSCLCGGRCGTWQSYILHHIWRLSDKASVSLNRRKSQSTEKYTIKPQKGPVLHPDVWL